MSTNSPAISESPLRILVVEDSIPFAKLIVAQLKAGLPTDGNVQHVDCVANALESLRDHEFDLIVLDMHLPDSSGLETFQTVSKAVPETPIVILSSDDTEELAIEAVRTGAQDYLIKAQDDGDKLMWSMKFAMERKKRLRAEGELHAARRIQQSLLPECDPIIKGYDIHGAMFPAVETSGDYYDFLVPIPSLGADINGIAVGDVSGHGLGAAMVMAETRGSIRSFALVEADLGRIFELTNQIIYRGNNDHFVTLFLGYIAPATGRLRYASAGHEAWHLRVGGENLQLDSTGMVLGIAEDATWEVAETEPMTKGDYLVIVTDGITEAMSPTGDMFGTDRLFEFIRSQEGQTAQEIVQSFHTHLLQFTNGAPPKDDKTMVLLEVVE